jgi:glycosyltransferase involved in cell wall biosynthesis
MRFHILGIPHTISTPEYSSCAFTQKVVKLCKMLKAEGHTVIHYGNAASKVECDENVAVTIGNDLAVSYPGHNWRKQGFPNFAKTDLCYKVFYHDAIEELGKRKQPGDFLLCAFGDWHKPVADAHPDMIVVESGIGYPNGAFAQFRVYESYAIMHAYQGNVAAVSASNSFWYDAVIPNSFDLADFEFSALKKKQESYLLFLGRLNAGKGLHIAMQLAERTNIPLIIAGAGAQETPTELFSYAGNVGPAKRRTLLRDARATICASTFLEPFCGVQIESMLSGTPVISSDRGAFAEYNLQGETGFRCRTFEQFEWAVRNVHKIDPNVCRAWAEQFSLEEIGPKYTDYFRSVRDIYGGAGWYEPRPDRTRLF